MMILGGALLLTSTMALSAFLARVALARFLRAMGINRPRAISHRSPRLDPGA